MMFKKFLTAFTILGALSLGAVSTARADDEKPKNLKVLSDNGKVEAGMKALTKGLGLKCNACHEKGKFDADTVPAKEDSRKFFTAVIGEKDQAKRDAALKTLLDVLKLKEAKNAADVWAGVDQLAKK